jgi:hypothetical protein
MAIHPVDPNVYRVDVKLEGCQQTPKEGMPSMSMYKIPL